MKDIGRYSEDTSLRKPKRASRAKCRLFLEHYATSANITASCKVAKLDRNTVFYLREHDEAFQEAFQKAHDTSVDALVAEVRRRALDGVREPTGWYKGEPGGYIQRYSDNLLMFEVKRQIPEYRDRWEVTGAGGQPLQIVLAAYGAQEGPNKGYKNPPPLSKEEKIPAPGPAAEDPPIEVEAKGV
ncbi:hypothetical protein IIA15_10825 [candidate division TA06 bacterium]|nr:hypothetical protein [candidate division TA06 bacterium]